MTDPLHELLSSPLEDEPKRRRRDRPERGPSPTAGPWLLAGIVAGALVMAAGYLLARPGEPDTTAIPPSQTTSTTTTTTTPAAALALPAGYTPIDGGRLGIRVERILVRQDAVFVTISTVVPSGIDGSETAGFPGGRWMLEFDDGSAVSSSEESRASASPGFATIRFDPVDAAGAPRALRLTGLGTRITDETVSESIEAFTLPAETEPADEPGPVVVGLTPSEFELDADVTLVFGDIVFEDGSGRLEWHLEGADDDVRAAAAPRFQLFDAGGEEIPVASPGGFGGFVFGGGVSFFEDVVLRREGDVAFSPIYASVPIPTGTPLRAIVTTPVVWQVYSPADAEIPIGDAPVTDLTE